MIRKACTSPKAAKTRGVMKQEDDGVNTSKQFKILINDVVSLRVFIDSRPMLENIGRFSQVAEKKHRQ